MPATINAKQFVATVRPLLADRDHSGLARVLQSRWSCSQLTSLLTHGEPDARSVAALCLSLVGDWSAVDPLCLMLCDPDPVLNQMAEHALWSIWFRSGTDEANHELGRGVQAIYARQYARAVTHFQTALEYSPAFAEAYNQRAIAHYLAEEYDLSIADCRKAVKLMPCHFGAWAGLGHCLVHQGHLRRALECYDKALSLNPHLESLRQSATELRSRLQST